MVILPANAFKLGEAITDIVEKCSCEDDKDKDAEKDSVTKESEEEKKKRLKNHPPAEMEPKDEDDDQKGPPEDDKSPAEKKDKAADVKRPEKKVVAAKAENTGNDAILAALKGIETTVAGLATKLDTVATEQTAQKKVLDDVVQKADTLSTTLATTVVAPPVDEDRPAGHTRMRTQKQDDDPRTGNFDTAFLRRRK